MNYKLGLILAIFIVTLLAISAVSAAENVTEDVVGIEETDEIVTVEEDNQVIESADNGIENLSAYNDEGTFTDLANDISNANGEFKLSKNYRYDSSKDSSYKNGITINKEITINGRGFIINGGNSACAFNVNYDNVILRNIEFTNCYNSDNGGAIYWNGNNGSSYDCGFINCNSSTLGGAIYWNGDNGHLFDCNFINCSCSKIITHNQYNNKFSSSSSSSGYGGAVYWNGSNGNLFDCNFTNCKNFISNTDDLHVSSSTSGMPFSSESSSSSSSFGGVVYWNGIGGALYNCDFINCYSYSYSKSISSSYFNPPGIYIPGSAYSISACYSYSYGVYWNGCNGTLSECNFINSSSSYSSDYTSDSQSDSSISSVRASSSSTSSSRGGAVYWNGANGTLLKCNFSNPTSYSSSSSSSKYGGAIYWYGNKGNLLNCTFINCHVPYMGYANAIYWFGDNGNILNCDFINSNSSSSSGYKGAVYWKGDQGNLYNCNFNGNYYDYEKYCKAEKSVYPIILIFNSTLKNDERIVIFESTQLVNNISVSLYNVTDRKILYDEFEISSEDLNSKLSLNGLEEGEYQIVLQYGGDKFFAGTSTNKLVLIGKNPSCEVTISEGLVEGDNATINLTLNEDATGSVKLTLSDYTFINELVDGKTSFVIPYVNGGINNYKIKYAGDDNYNPVYIDDAFIVLCESEIFLDLKENYTIYENISLSYTITPNCTGIISIFVDNVFNSNISVGDVFEFEDIDVGVHNITVIYNGDEYYLASNDSTIITVSKVTPSMSVNSSVIDDTASFEVILNDRATGNVILSINGDSYSGSLIDGKVNFTISDLTPGDYNCVIDYEGDANFNQTSTSLVVSISKWNTEIITNNYTFTYGSKIIVELSMANTTATGNITLFVDDLEYAAPLNNNKARFTLPTLDAGTYQFTAVYGGNQYYDSTSAEGSIVVNKYNNVGMSIEYLTDLIYGNPVIMNVTFNKPVTGTASFNIEGKDYLEEVIDGKTTFNLDVLDAKKYKITIAYSGDENYGAKNKTFSFTVNRATPTIDVNITNNTYGEALTVDVQMPSDVTRRVSVSIDGNSKFVSLKSGYGSIKFTGLSVGAHDFVVSYGGDSNYAKASDAYTINVNKGNADIKITADAINCGEDLIVGVELPSDVSGNVNLVVGSISKSVSLKNGVGTASFSNLAIGTYTIKASFAGDNNYLKSSAKTTVKVNRYVPDIILTADTINCGEDLIVNVELPSDVKYRVNVSVSGMSNLVSLKNGVGSTKFSGLSIGTYTITAYYGGDSKYANSSAKTTVKVDKYLTDIKVTADNINYGQDLVVNIQAPSDIKYRVNVTVDGESKLISLNNGVGSVVFSNLAAGTYDVTVSYAGDSNYLKTSVTTTVKVTKSAADIQLSVENITVGDDLVVNVQLPSDVTRRVTVSVGNESVLVSLKNGCASLTFEDLALGSYDVTVSYSGDSKYLKSTVSTTIIVSKAIPEIQITANDITYGSDATVYVTLPSDVSRRAVVEIDGVSKAVSLNNGKGFVKFSGLDIGSHIVNVSYNGDSKYLAYYESTMLKVKA